MKYLEKANESFSLILHSQLIINAMSIFEVRHLDVLEHLPTYFDLLKLSFSRLELNNKDFFSESYTKSLLKATLSLCTFFAKFLTALQYESIINNVIVLSDDYQSEVKACLDVIS